MSNTSAVLETFHANFLSLCSIKSFSMCSLKSWNLSYCSNKSVGVSFAGSIGYKVPHFYFRNFLVGKNDQTLNNVAQLADISFPVHGL
jgi:hypothetical protein